MARSPSPRAFRPTARPTVRLRFRLATTPPAVTITQPPSGSSLKVSPDIQGSVTDAAGVQQFTVSINGGAAQTVAVDSHGNFSFNPNFATDGSADGYYF